MERTISIMNAKELYLLVNSGEKPVVKFNKRAELQDSNFDEGMMAEIVSAHDNGDCYVFDCCFAKFEEYNKAFMKPNYYDNNGNPTLKWCETGFYPKDKCDDIYVGYDDDESTFPFELVIENKVLKLYLDEKSPLSYVEWLEQKVAELIISE
jgi:hypothetical protein